MSGPCSTEEVARRHRGAQDLDAEAEGLHELVAVGERLVEEKAGVDEDDRQVRGDAAPQVQKDAAPRAERRREEQPFAEVSTANARRSSGAGLSRRALSAASARETFTQRTPLRRWRPGSRSPRRCRSPLRGPAGRRRGRPSAGDHASGRRAGRSSPGVSPSACSPSKSLSSTATASGTRRATTLTTCRPKRAPSASTPPPRCSWYIGYVVPLTVLAAPCQPMSATWCCPHEFGQPLTP